MFISKLCFIFTRIHKYTKHLKTITAVKLRRFRIVRDRYAGYEAQQWRLWWPFWTQIGFTNTHKSIEEAERFIKNRGVVRYVDVQSNKHV